MNLCQTPVRQQYDGQVRSVVDRSDLKLVESSYRPGQAIDAHSHGHPIVVVVMTGLQSERAWGRTVDCRAGSAFYHPPGAPHANRFGRRGANCLIIEFRPSWVHKLAQSRELMRDHPVVGNEYSVTAASELLYREFCCGHEAHPAALDGLALTLLSALTGEGARPADRHPAFLARVLEKLRDEPATGTSLASLAGLAGVSPAHLARAFHEHMHCTIGQYVRRLRVDRACRALARNDMALADLALELGFHDQPHFNRIFKAHTGCSPGEYRRRRLGDHGRDGSKES